MLATSSELLTPSVKTPASITSTIVVKQEDLSEYIDGPITLKKVLTPTSTAPASISEIEHIESDNSTAQPQEKISKKGYKPIITPESLRNELASPSIDRRTASPNREPNSNSSTPKQSDGPTVVEVFDDDESFIESSVGEAIALEVGGKVHAVRDTVEATGGMCPCGITNEPEWNALIACARCNQPYHMKCIPNLARSTQILVGDNLYHIECDRCTKGSFFVQRLSSVLRERLYIVLYNANHFGLGKVLSGGRMVLTRSQILDQLNKHWMFLSGEDSFSDSRKTSISSKMSMLVSPLKNHLTTKEFPIPFTRKTLKVENNHRGGYRSWLRSVIYDIAEDGTFKPPDSTRPPGLKPLLIDTIVPSPAVLKWKDLDKVVVSGKREPSIGSMSPSVLKRKDVGAGNGSNNNGNGGLEDREDAKTKLSRNRRSMTETQPSTPSPLTAPNSAPAPSAVMSTSSDLKRKELDGGVENCDDTKSRTARVRRTMSNPAFENLPPTPSPLSAPQAAVTLSVPAVVANSTPVQPVVSAETSKAPPSVVPLTTSTTTPPVKSLANQPHGTSNDLSVAETGKKLPPETTSTVATASLESSHDKPAAEISSMEQSISVSISTVPTTMQPADSATAPSRSSSVPLPSASQQSQSPKPDVMFVEPSVPPSRSTSVPPGPAPMQPQIINPQVDSRNASTDPSTRHARSPSVPPPPASRQSQSPNGRVPSTNFPFRSQGPLLARTKLGMPMVYPSTNTISPTGSGSNVTGGGNNVAFNWVYSTTGSPVKNAGNGGSSASSSSEDMSNTGVSAGSTTTPQTSESPAGVASNAISSVMTPAPTPMESPSSAAFITPMPPARLATSMKNISVSAMRESDCAKSVAVLSGSVAVEASSRGSNEFMSSSNLSSATDVSATIASAGGLSAPNDLPGGTLMATGDNHTTQMELTMDDVVQGGDTGMKGTFAANIISNEISNFHLANNPEYCDVDMSDAQTIDISLNDCDTTKCDSNHGADIDVNILKTATAMNNLESGDVHMMEATTLNKDPVETSAANEDKIHAGNDSHLVQTTLTINNDANRVASTKPSATVVASSMETPTISDKRTASDNIEVNAIMKPISTSSKTALPAQSMPVSSSANDSSQLQQTNASHRVEANSGSIEKVEKIVATNTMSTNTEPHHPPTVYASELQQMELRHSQELVRVRELFEKSQREMEGRYLMILEEMKKEVGGLRSFVVGEREREMQREREREREREQARERESERERERERESARQNELEREKVKERERERSGSKHGRQSSAVAAASTSTKDSVAN
ncbi:hypothetical protein HDU76_012175, partial [Blyttiomyces sp. JEL0837]